MRQQQPVALQSILRHEQPARQAFFDLSLRIGERRPGALNTEHVRVSQAALQERAALLNGTAEVICADALSLALSLHENLTRRSSTTMHQGKSCHAFEPDHTNLRLPAHRITVDRHYRDKS